MRCTSCKTELLTEADWAKFKCPECGEAEIARCSRCRNQVVLYKCPSCSFEGP